MTRLLSAVTRLSLLTDAAMNRNCGLKAVSPAASSATDGLIRREDAPASVDGEHRDGAAEDAEQAPDKDRQRRPAQARRIGIVVQHDVLVALRRGIADDGVRVGLRQRVEVAAIGPRGQHAR